MGQPYVKFKVRKAAMALEKRHLRQCSPDRFKSMTMVPSKGRLSNASQKNSQCWMKKVAAIGGKMKQELPKSFKDP